VNSFTQSVSLAILLAMAPSVLADQSYTFPAHKDISLNNYDETGFKAGEMPLKFSSKDQITVGATIMVNDRYQRVWKKNAEGYEHYSSLARLDRIKILDLNTEDENDYIQVEVEASSDRKLVGEILYTRIQGLSEYQDYKDIDADVYIIQNVATEKLRVYQRICKDMSCTPKMIFETDMVVGLKKGDDDFKYNTHVGSYRIFEWEKFYQDRGTGGHYPSWFDASYPEQPTAEDNWSSWFDSDVMPWEFCKGSGDDQKCSHKGMMRGAFGWYTALVEPHYGTGQWTHGTIGWGQSSADMVSRAKGEDALGVIANMFTSLRSSGCSRLSNPAVAFLRHLVPVGTPLIKIYALESYQDQESMERNYPQGQTAVWNYLLTKDGVRKTNEAATTAHKNYVEKAGLATLDNILEEGLFEFNTSPSVIQYQHKPKKNARGYRRSMRCVEDTVDNYTEDGEFINRKDRSKVDPSTHKAIKSRKCNVYKIPTKAFKGRFYVDTGLVEGYAHPEAEGIIRGGFRSERWPSFMNATNYKK
jgi:hypothetical protein